MLKGCLFLIGVAGMFLIPVVFILIDNWHKRWAWRKADQETRAAFKRRGMRLPDE